MWAIVLVVLNLLFIINYFSIIYPDVHLSVMFDIRQISCMARLASFLIGLAGIGRRSMYYMLST